MTLYRRTTNNGVTLSFAVTELGQVVNGVMTGLTIGNAGIQVVLLTVFINRNTFKDQVIVVFRYHFTWLKDWVFNLIFRHTIFDDINAHVNPTGHFNRATEGDFTVTL